MSKHRQSSSSDAVSVSAGTQKYPICSNCGSEAVVKDAWSSWNPETRLWELKDVFDDKFCLNCEENTTLELKIKPETKNAKIRRLNDEMRAGKSKNGEIFITSGIQALGPILLAEVMKAVAEFDSFTPENDPHSEHDFGSMDVQGEKVIFKIDYFDLEMDMLSPEPSDPSATKRALTLLLESEY